MKGYINLGIQKIFLFPTPLSLWAEMVLILLFTPSWLQKHILESERELKHKTRLFKSSVTFSLISVITELAAKGHSEEEAKFSQASKNPVRTQQQFHISDIHTFDWNHLHFTFTFYIYQNSSHNNKPVTFYIYILHFTFKSFTFYNSKSNITNSSQNNKPWPLCSDIHTFDWNIYHKKQHIYTLIHKQ